VKYFGACTLSECHSSSISKADQFLHHQEDQSCSASSVAIVAASLLLGLISVLAAIFSDTTD
jgi:hypothetical protein